MGDAPRNRSPLADARFEALAEDAQGLIAELSPDGRLLFWNRGFSELMGTDGDGGPPVGVSAADFIHPADLNHVARMQQESVEYESPRELVFRCRAHDGRWRWVELRGRPYRTDEGELRIVVTGRDITNRMLRDRDEQARIQAESRIARLARRFLALESHELDAGILEGLAEAGRLAGADRVQLLALGRNASEVLQHSEWCSEGITGRSPHHWLRRGKRFDWMARRLVVGQTVHIPDVAELPPAAADERMAFQADETRSYLAIPLRVGSVPFACLDFCAVRRTRSWRDAEIAGIELLAGVLASLLRRKQAEDERHRVQGKLEHQLAMEQRIAGLSREFLSLAPEDMEEELRRGVALAAALGGANRAHLLAIDQTGGEDHELFEWKQEGAPGLEDSDWRSYFRHFHYFTERFLAGDTIHVPSVANLPEEAAEERGEVGTPGANPFVGAGALRPEDCEGEPWLEVRVAPPALP